LADMAARAVLRVSSNPREARSTAGRARGGWGGNRTHGELAPTAVFKTGALNPSATPPGLFARGNPLANAGGPPAPLPRTLAGHQPLSPNNTSGTRSGAGCARRRTPPPTLIPYRRRADPC